MLPPAFEQKDPHLYGTLTLTISSLQFLPISSVEPHFFGRAKPQSQSCESSTSVYFQYGIATNLWHFYSYLTDCRTISVILTGRNNQVYTSQIQLQLLPSGQVLNRFTPSIDYLFRGNSYLLNKRQTINVYDRKHKVMGTLEAEVKISFEEEIHRTVYDNNLVDFDEILVIDEISPIPSSVDFQQSFLEAEEQPPTPNPSYKFNILESQITHLRDTHIQMTQPETKETPKMEDDHDDDEKMLEDDIDRMIAEMQSKPYDSSRYLQDSKQPETITKQNLNYQNYSNSSLSRQKKSLEKHSSCEKRPPKAKPAGVTPSRPFQPINSYTVGFSQQRTNRLINSQVLSQTQRTQRSTSRQRPAMVQQKIGIIKLKIHQLMVQRLQSELSLLLKVYLNEESREYYSTNSLRQGEAITFNSHLKIEEKINIEHLRFDLIDTFDLKTIYGQGVFDMKRLHDQNPSKGIFMVNLLTPQGNRPSSGSKVVRVDEGQVVRATPNLKSLRIELQYEEPIQIVQVYFSLSEFSQVCKVCRYKIPMTKETIEFRISDLSKSKHVNIFPHNRSSSSTSGQKIIVELWSETELVGFSEISLKPLYNTNQKMINCSLDPIALYSETRETSDFKGSKTKGSFKLNLSFGTISQVQNLLNQNPRRQFERPQTEKRAVEVESHLGIYLKETKTKKEVETQVDNEVIEGESSGTLSRKVTMSLLQQQQLPQEDEEEDLEGDVSIKTEENQFLNRTLQQKYLKNETVSVLSKQQNSQKYHEASGSENNFSRTVQERVHLRSLTKQFQDLIKDTLSCFQNEKMFHKLKSECQEHLLYNFIDRSKLADIFDSLGLGAIKIEVTLSQILSHSNEMTNINMLFDLIYGLILDGTVKQKYIDDSQMGRYCLTNFFKAIKEEKTVELESVIFDDDLEYGEAKKWFERARYRLTMREFNQIEQYLKKIKDQNPGIDWSKMKEDLLNREEGKTVKEEGKKQYEKGIEAQIYNNFEWDDEDDFFISNINKPHEDKSEVPSSIQYLPKHEEEQEKNKTAFKMEDRCEPSSRFQSLGKKDSQSLLQNEQPLSGYLLTIQGLENCIEATECHLNIKLVSVQFRVSYGLNVNNVSVYVRREEKKRLYEVQILSPGREEYLDGCIQLLNFQTEVAKCNFSIIKNVRSVYTLKSIPEAEFCGLIYLQFSER